MGKALPTLSKSQNYLVISDLQIPFEHPKALDFCRMLVKEFNVSKENILNAGDEFDIWAGSQYKKNPNAPISSTEEIRITIDRVKAWYKTFPKMRLAISNHGQRWVRKAIDAEIPEMVLKNYRDIFQAPDGWVWQDEWIIKAKKKTFRMIHGHGYSGIQAARNAAYDAGISTVIGHVHSFAGVQYFRTRGRDNLIWAANSGCLIDEKSFAFEYSSQQRHKATIGCLVVIDGGTTPIFVPFSSL